MKHFLRRKSSKVNGDEKHNKNNAKVNSLAVIEDNEAQSQHSTESASQEVEVSTAPSMNRRASIAETIDSTSTTESKKKERYLARLAAQSQQQPQLGPWMAMSPMSHSAMTTNTKTKARPKPKPKAEGSLASAAQSTESVPASIASTVPISVMSVEAPNSPPSPSYLPPDVPSSMNSPRRTHSPVGGSPMGVSPIALGPSSGFPSTRSSLMVPPSPSVYVTPPALPPQTPSSRPITSTAYKYVWSFTTASHDGPDGAFGQPISYSRASRVVPRKR
ncbi:hypothetical protein TWF281_004682 [Arthrobotrys megalospora]